MCLINNYFDFKKRNLVSYASLFLDDEENTLGYLRSYIDTYIDTFYYHVLNTYYDKVVKKFDGAIIIKELKGKRLELLDELDDANGGEANLINNCYKYAFVAIIIDVINFDNCFKLVEFKDKLGDTLVNKKRLIEYDENILSKLSGVVKEAVVKERKFFNLLNEENFNINFYSYRDNLINKKVVLEYNIESLEKNYTSEVIEKNYKSDKIKAQKFDVTMNLLNMTMLKKIISNGVIDNYFIDVPIAQIKDRKHFERVVKSVDNSRLKDNIVFVVNYNEYVQNKSMFKNLGDFTFAINVDLSRTVSAEKRLSEIEEMELFHYVIIDGVKNEDLQMVENYVIKGKIMFMNEMNML